jgi:hypothetical protein
MESNKRYIRKKFGLGDDEKSSIVLDLYFYVLK